MFPVEAPEIFAHAFERRAHPGEKAGISIVPLTREHRFKISNGCECVYRPKGQKEYRDTIACPFEAASRATRIPPRHVCAIASEQ